ncbi:hypothetical protein [Agathobaculum sp.]|uniref:hypothetical protein n=1 Tax=Agathobaculum sp. TaxID=2048138 RepID=UPI003AF0D72A
MARHPFLLRRQTELLLAELNAAPSAGNAYAALNFGTSSFAMSVKTHFPVVKQP